MAASDGSDILNPGSTMRQVGEPGAGFLVVDADDPSVCEDMLKRAAASLERA